ncbi:hypothetical protein BDV12DRAFT_61194 [Aspergillus spectabilis]
MVALAFIPPFFTFYRVVLAVFDFRLHAFVDHLILLSTSQCLLGVCRLLFIIWGFRCSTSSLSEVCFSLVLFSFFFFWHWVLAARFLFSIHLFEIWVMGIRNLGEQANINHQKSYYWSLI